MKLIYAYKNFAANKCISHIGLGVSAMNTCKTLSENGIRAIVWPIVDGNDLRQRLRLDSDVTHVVIAAPWIPTEGLFQLCALFPDIQFAVNCHSNVGFLQADTRGVKLIREALDLEMSVHNFTVAANSRKMTKWTTDAYGNPCTYLPNLYYLDGANRLEQPSWNGNGVLRIGAFGATRPQKNFLCAVGAAVELGYQLKAQTEIWVNTGRLEGGGGCILSAAKEMVDALPSVTLMEAPWCTWPQFRRLVGSMHLLFQPSDTESFNMVTADGVVEGVPSVTSFAVDWVPQHWKATLDDCFDMARIGRFLLFDMHAKRDGMYALTKYVNNGLVAWRSYLGI